MAPQLKWKLACQLATLLAPLCILLTSCTGTRHVPAQMPAPNPRGTASAPAADPIPPMAPDASFNPGAFKPDFDYRAAVRAIVALRGDGPWSPAQQDAFSRVLRDIHLDLLEYRAGLEGLSPEAKRQVAADYSAMHPDVASDFLLALRPVLQAEVLPQRQYTYSYPMYAAVDAFTEILSRRICDLSLYAVSLGSKNILVSAADPAFHPICERLLAEAVGPLSQLMADYALVLDGADVGIRVTQHVRESIAELATAQDRYAATFDATYTRCVLKLFTSQADITTEVRAVIKAGFDLSRGFSVALDGERRRVQVTLPPPQILSVDLSHEIVRMEDGWFIEVDEQHLNDALRLGRERLVNDALRTGLLQRAQDQGVRVLRTILEPLASDPRMGYQVLVRIGREPERPLYP